ncbi:hypothetical protein BB561_000740 [Smittium simulii]|uniref:Uncharacterized protein n=1 Tax=Smittium simulii TaxID=133385 RepID=A0A2T9YXV1_9FUNG|nr:hypothetical protein BB561_000740 [Smittium simulii]
MDLTGSKSTDTPGKRPQETCEDTNTLATPLKPLESSEVSKSQVSLHSIKKAIKKHNLLGVSKSKSLENSKELFKLPESKTLITPLSELATSMPYNDLRLKAVSKPSSTNISSEALNSNTSEQKNNEIASTLSNTLINSTFKDNNLSAILKTDVNDKSKLVKLSDHSDSSDNSSESISSSEFSSESSSDSDSSFQDETDAIRNNIVENKVTPKKNNQYSDLLSRSDNTTSLVTPKSDNKTFNPFSALKSTTINGHALNKDSLSVRKTYGSKSIVPRVSILPKTNIDRLNNSKRNSLFKL